MKRKYFRWPIYLLGALICAGWQLVPGVSPMERLALGLACIWWSISVGVSLTKERLLNRALLNEHLANELRKKGIKL